MRALVVLPMVLPPVVGGVALLYAFQRNGGLVGGWLYDAFGFQLTFSKAGVVLAETFVAMPFLVITVEAGAAIDGPALRGRGREPRRRSLDGVPPGDAAADRARRSSPAPRSAWARALGEFGATITFAGNIQGRTQTTPLAVYLLLESDQPVRDRAQPRAARGVGRRARARCATAGSEVCVTLGR